MKDIGEKTYIIQTWEASSFFLKMVPSASDLSNRKCDSDEKVADSAAETDSDESSYPARVDYPGLVKRVSTQVSFGLHLEEDEEGEDEDGGIQKTFGKKRQCVKRKKVFSSSSSSEEDKSTTKLLENQNSTSSSPDEDKSTVKQPAYPSQSPVSCDGEVRGNLPADLSNQKCDSDEKVADSAAETDSNESSYPARVDYPGLVNRVSTQVSLGLHLEEDEEGEDEDGGIQKTFGDDDVCCFHRDTLHKAMELSRYWKCAFCTFGFICLLTALSIFVLTQRLKRCDERPFEVRYDIRYHAPWLKENIVNELNEIHLEMEKLRTSKQAPSTRLVQRLGHIVKRLDNRLEPASIPTETGNKNGSVVVCPEVYKGSILGYPYFAENCWYTTNCTNAKPIRSVITILVNTVAHPKEDANPVVNALKGITETYPTVQVHLATTSNEMKLVAEKYHNIDVVKLDDTKLSKAWNKLITRTTTPYVLVARDIYHFTWLTQLERQIRVLSQIPNVAVAGGAYRNVSGHWNAGCVQTKLKNYVLEYQEGYYHSKNECMFCDHLQGPFVTKANLLQLDESLPDEVVFEDWFLHVVQDGALIMACPDAMYFSRQYHSYSKRSDKTVWIPLAKKWELNRVLLPQGVKHSFSCQDISFNCANSKKSGLLPVCCQELYEEAVSFFQKFADARNISFELDSGSVLGGVKFNGLIPWDIDGDFFVFSKDIPIFNKKETIEYFKKHGYILTGYESPKPNRKVYDRFNGYVNIVFGGFNIEVFGTGWPSMSNSVYLPQELRNHDTFTKANIGGNWVDTKFSPGLYARNRYGREILKHSQSWRKVGLQHSYADYDPGSFEPCENPMHHACLQSFPGDGNIPFMVT